MKSINSLICLFLVGIALLYTVLDLGNLYKLWYVEIDSVKKILNALYVLYWGILFILTSQLKTRCFLFKGIYWVCMNLSVPKGERVNLFWGIVFIILGTIYTIKELIKNYYSFVSGVYTIIALFFIIIYLLSFVRYVKRNERLITIKNSKLEKILGPGFVFIPRIIIKTKKIDLNDYCITWEELTESEIIKSIQENGIDFMARP